MQPLSAFAVKITEDLNVKMAPIPNNATTEQLDRIMRDYADRISYITQITHQGDILAKCEFLSRVLL